jgi:hypothetical protein
MLETKYTELLNNMEIPVDDAIVISHFMKDLDSNLDGKKYTRGKLNKALRKTLLGFN